jgi:hypothetical protein
LAAPWQQVDKGEGVAELLGAAAIRVPSAVNGVTVGVARAAQAGTDRGVTPSQDGDTDPVSQHRASHHKDLQAVQMNA